MMNELFNKASKALYGHHDVRKQSKQNHKFDTVQISGQLVILAAYVLQWNGEITMYN